MSADPAAVSSAARPIFEQIKPSHLRDYKKECVSIEPESR